MPRNDHAQLRDVEPNGRWPRRTMRYFGHGRRWSVGMVGIQTAEIILGQGVDADASEVVTLEQHEALRERVRLPSSCLAFLGP